MNFILAAMACADGERTKTQPTINEEFLAVHETVRAFVQENNQEEVLPLSPQTDYFLGEGVAVGELAENGSFDYSVDANKIYEGMGFDGPQHIIAGEQDGNYDAERFEPGDIRVNLTVANFVGNAEEEKDDTFAVAGYPFAEEYPFGSYYVSLASSNDTAEESCRHGSPVRFVSDYAKQFHPWFAAFDDLTDQAAVPQSQMTWWPDVLVHENNNIADNFVRNIAGAFESVPLDDNPENPTKLELGAMAQIIGYRDMTVGVLPGSISSQDTDPLCIRVYESDGALLGSTGLLQVQIPSPHQTITAIRQQAGLDHFSMYLGHHVLDETTVFAARCDASGPLEDVAVLPPFPVIDGARVIDVSATLCTNQESISRQFANMTLIGLEFFQ